MPSCWPSGESHELLASPGYNKPPLRLSFLPSSAGSSAISVKLEVFQTAWRDFLEFQGSSSPAQSRIWLLTWRQGDVLGQDLAWLTGNQSQPAPPPSDSPACFFSDPCQSGGVEGGHPKAHYQLTFFALNQLLDTLE